MCQLLTLFKCVHNVNHKCIPQSKEPNVKLSNTPSPSLIIWKIFVNFILTKNSNDKHFLEYCHKFWVFSVDVLERVSWCVGAVECELLLLGYVDHSMSRDTSWSTHDTRDTSFLMHHHHHHLHPPTQPSSSVTLSSSLMRKASHDEYLTFAGFGSRTDQIDMTMANRKPERKWWLLLKT